MGISMNSLRVENFLIFYSIRCGALTILWSVMLSFFYSLITVWTYLVKTGNVTAVIFLLTIVLFVGEVMAVLNLIYFPAPNKTYSPDSKTAKYLKYFAWYLCFIIVMLVVQSFYCTVDALFDPKFDSVPLIQYIASIKYFSTNGHRLSYFYVLLGICIASPFIVTAVVVHLLAVMYSFHLSILPNNNTDEIHNDVNVSDNVPTSPVVFKMVELLFDN